MIAPLKNRHFSQDGVPNHHNYNFTQLVITVIFLLIQQLAFDDSPEAYYSNPIYVLLDQYMVSILITMLIMLKS